MEGRWEAKGEKESDDLEEKKGNIEVGEEEGNYQEGER